MHRLDETQNFCAEWQELVTTLPTVAWVVKHTALVLWRSNLPLKTQMRSMSYNLSAFQCTMFQPLSFILLPFTIPHPPSYSKVLQR